MKKIDVLGKGSCTIILDLNDYEVYNVLVRGDVRIIDAIKIAEKELKKYIKDIKNDYEGVLDYEIIGINKGYKYLIIDKSENGEHIFRDREDEETDGISELLWIVEVSIIEHYIK